VCRIDRRQSLLVVSTVPCSVCAAMVQRELFLVEPQATALAETQKLITQYAQTRKCRDRVRSLARLLSPPLTRLAFLLPALRSRPADQLGAGRLRPARDRRHAESVPAPRRAHLPLLALRLVPQGPPYARPAPASIACLPLLHPLNSAAIFARRATAALAGGAVLLPSARHVSCGDPGTCCTATL
jgi:hypothetical protein